MSSPLLDTVPLGRLLGHLLRLLISRERSEEFLGDLVEDWNLRPGTGTRTDLALWLWRETLRSVPTLIAWRIRLLVARAHPLSSPLSTASTVLVGSRVGHRGWPLSLALSLSAHVLVLIAAVGWVLSRVEEIEPPRFQDFSAAFLPEAATPDEATGVAPRALKQARPLRLRLARRPAIPAPASSPAAAESADPASSPAVAVASSGALPPGTPSGNPPHRGSGADIHEGGSDVAQPRIRLPPRVGEKRCLSCPAPQLPHPYARLGLGREMLVKTCVSTRGTVKSVEVLSGFEPAVDARVIETIRGWRLAPFSVDGHAVPFCYETRFLFTTH